MPRKRKQVRDYSAMASKRWQQEEENGSVDKNNHSPNPVQLLVATDTNLRIANKIKAMNEIEDLHQLNQGDQFVAIEMHQTGQQDQTTKQVQTTLKDQTQNEDQTAQQDQTKQQDETGQNDQSRQQIGNSEIEYVFFEFSQLQHLLKKVKCAKCDGESLNFLKTEAHGFLHKIIMECKDCVDAVYEKDESSSEIYTSKRVINEKSSRPAFDINLRLSTAFLYIGKGCTGMKNFL